MDIQIIACIHAHKDEFSEDSLLAFKIRSVRRDLWFSLKFFIRGKDS